jgi:RNA polymerase sigma-70 factor (ECF subfamily)
MLASMDVESRVGERLTAGAVEEAATIAIEGYGPAILGYLCSMLDEDDARDAFSMFAEDLWRGIPGFRRECSLRAWAFRLGWHAAARFLRDPYRKRRERLPSSAASRLAASVAASSMMPGGRRDQLRRLRDMLDPEDRTLLVLRIDKGMDWQDISAVLSAEGAPVTSVALRKRFERLKDRLARLARAEGLIA